MNLRTHTSGAHIIPILGIGLSVLVFRPGAAAWPAIQERVEDRQETTQRCDSLTSLVYQTFDERAEAGAGALRVISGLSAEAEACYGQARTQRRIWLLGMRVWALDEMRRYREAAALVDRFFQTLSDSAGAEPSARMLRYLVRFRSFEGDFNGAVEALDRTREFAEGLTEDQQLHVRLTRASLHLDRLAYERALSISGNVLRDIEQLGAPDSLAFAYARALSIRAEARLEQHISRSATRAEPKPTDGSARSALRNPALDMETAATLYGELGMTGRQSKALATSAEMRARMGDDGRAAELTSAARALALESRDIGARVNLLYRQGRMRLHQGAADLSPSFRRLTDGGTGRVSAFDEAERLIERALALSDSSGYLKYRYDLEYELARLFERRRDLAEAQERYERLALSLPPVGEGAIRAVALIERAERSARDIGMKRLRREHNLYIAALVLLFVVAALSVGVAVASRRRLTSDEWRLDLLAQVSEVGTLRYLYETVVNPEQVARQIRKCSRFRSRRLSRGKLRGRMDLYECLADLVTVVEGKEVTANAVRLWLGRLFDRNRWDWPEGEDPLDAWRRFFEGRDVD